VLAAAAVSLLVLDLVSSGVGPAELRVASDEVASAALSARPGEVATMESVRDVLDTEARRQLLGCDDGGCAAQLAGTLGAREVVAGSVTLLGKAYFVQLRLIDAQDATVKRRAAAQAGGADDLPDAVRRASFELLGAVYVPAVRHRAERENEAYVRGGYRVAEARRGFAVAAGVLWRLGPLHLGPEAAVSRTYGEVRDTDLAGFDPAALPPTAIAPTRVDLGVTASWRRGLLERLGVYAQAGAGLGLHWVPDLTNPTLTAWVRPAGGVRLAPGAGDLSFSLEAAWLLALGTTSAPVREFNAFGEARRVDVTLRTGGPELVLGVQRAF
jgi:hypothetical protein